MASRAYAPATTMRAGVLTAPAETAVVEARLPEPAAGEVLVRVEGCGVCASNLPVWEGRPWFSYPLDPGAPGHEGWGVVEAVGDAETELSPGDRVAMINDRAFAEYAVTPAAYCVRIGDGPFPGEPVACAVNIVRRAEVDPGMRVAIVGMGFIGSLVGLLCERDGVHVVAVRRDSSVEGPFDCVIEAAGTQEALDTASALVGVRGRLVIAGYHQDGPRTIDLQSWNWRGLDVVNAHERDPLVYVEAMRIGVAAGIDFEPLLTHRYPLEQLAGAFEAARTRPDGFVKAWVAP
jgi:threonine dehydrogenase-like Zn-dependent dehydrogenase